MYAPGICDISPTASFSLQISTLGQTFACACEAMGPRDMGEGNTVDLGKVCWCLSCCLGIKWGPRCSSASVPADEGSMPGVSGGVGGGKGALQVVGNFWLSLEMGTGDAESLPEFRGDTLNFLMPHRFLQECIHSTGFQWNGARIQQNGPGFHWIVTEGTCISACKDKVIYRQAVVACQHHCPFQGMHFPFWVKFPMIQ